MQRGMEFRRHRHESAGRPGRVIPLIQQRPVRPLLGARASRPHKAWRSQARLSDFDQPERAPWRSLRPADAVAAGDVDGRVGRERLRAGRPRSQGKSSSPTTPVKLLDQNLVMLHLKLRS